jgi:hypothetical protein
MANIEDRRGELPEYWMGDPRREAEEARMRMLYRYNLNTPLSPLAEALGGHQIENSPVAQRWIDRNMPQERQQFDLYQLPNQNYFGTKPEPPPLGRALQELQLQVNPEARRVEGQIPLAPGLALEGGMSSPVDWKMLMRLRGQF